MNDQITLLACGLVTWALLGTVSVGALWSDGKDSGSDGGLKLAIGVFWPVVWAGYAGVVFYRLGDAIGRRLP